MKKHLIYLLTLIWATQSFAQKNTDISELLKDSVISRQLSEMLVVVVRPLNWYSPFTIKKIDAADIELLNGREPSFLLAQTPSVTNYSDAGSFQGYAYFRLRGIDQTRINLTLDGIPLNEPEDQGAYFSNYTDLLNSAGALYLTRGAGISKNGVANYGGSIQISGPNLYERRKLEVGSGYGSFNTTRNYIEYNAGHRGKITWYGRLSQTYSDGYKYNSSNNSQSGWLTGQYDNRRTKLKINLIAGNQQNKMAWLGVADSLIQKDRRTNANGPEKDHFSQGMLQVLHSYTSGSNTISSGAWYSALNGNYDFDLNNLIGLPSTNELYNYAFKSDWAGGFSSYSYKSGTFKADAGVQGNTYKRQHTGSERSAGELYQNTGFKNELSGFGRLEYNRRNFGFFGEVQARYAAFNYAGSVKMDELSWFFLNPKAGITYQSRDRLIFYYSIAGTGREPTRNDIFGGSDDLPAGANGEALFFNTKAEHVTDQELGFRLTKNKLNIEANVYYMDFTNEIVLDGKFGPNGIALTNSVERSFRAGVEITFIYYASGSLKFTNNSSYNESRVQQQNVTFTPILTPRFIFNQEAAYLWKYFTFALSYRFQERAFINYANTESVGSYHLLNGRISYDYKKLGCSLQIGNITNSKYYNQGYIEADGTRKLFVQAPVNFLLSVKYRIL